ARGGGVAGGGGPPHPPEPRGWAAEVAELNYVERPDDEPAVMLFTSGTTGVPKPVRFSHSTLMEYLYTSATPPEIGSTECSVVCVPCYHVAGLTAVLSSLYSGRRIRTLRG